MFKEKDWVVLTDEYTNHVKNNAKLLKFNPKFTEKQIPMQIQEIRKENTGNLTIKVSPSPFKETLLEYSNFSVDKEFKGLSTGMTPLEKTNLRLEERAPKVGERIIISNEYRTIGDRNLYASDFWFRETIPTVIGIKDERDKTKLTLDSQVASFKTNTNINKILYLRNGYQTKDNNGKLIPFLNVITTATNNELVLNAEYDDNIYCKCINPEVITNTANWITFKVCKKCGKERM